MMIKYLDTLCKLKFKPDKNVKSCLKNIKKIGSYIEIWKKSGSRIWDTEKNLDLEPGKTLESGKTLDPES